MPASTDIVEPQSASPITSSNVPPLTAFMLWVTVMPISESRTTKVSPAPTPLRTTERTHVVSLWASCDGGSASVAITSAIFPTTGSPLSTDAHHGLA